ncbi:GNAT family N-acetyltransferase [Streptomyces virginiae]|uniref:GNAT family N-acetyltransferase n=1 Tax=Streptomyces virginiae TaxID=1961 RepID=UPI002DC063B6|nr:GNAT family protein [Streptomyces sp. CMAA1738]MEC4576311.1 GNAT family protein [Streptomyces sp. CMAA1738]
MDLPQPLALRPFRPAADAATLRGWLSGPTDLMTWAGPNFRWPLDDAQLTAYAAEPGRRTWTGVSPDGTPLGHVSLADGRLGRVLIAPGARGRGLGERLVSLAVRVGFDELDLPEIGLGVWTHNTAALRIYEKLGFRTTATLEAVETVDGTPWSVHRMRLTASDRRQ